MRGEYKITRIHLKKKGLRVKEKEKRGSQGG